MHVEVAPEWRRLADEVTGGRTCMIYITGESDSGKTTCAGFLRGHLEDSGTSADYLDCDPGQSSVGPPATIGLRGGSRELLRFAGSRTGTGVHGPGGPGSTRRLA